MLTGYPAHWVPTMSACGKIFPRGSALLLMDDGQTGSNPLGLQRALGRTKPRNNEARLTRSQMDALPTLRSGANFRLGDNPPSRHTPHTAMNEHVALFRSTDNLYLQWRSIAYAPSPVNDSLTVDRRCEKKDSSRGSVRRAGSAKAKYPLPKAWHAGSDSGILSPARNPLV
jgi:hypothetical protein